MTRFLLSISLIPAGLAAGLILKNMTDRSIRPRLLTGKIKKAIQTISLLLLNPVAFTGAVWILPLHNLEMIFLPVLGVAAISLGGIYSVIYSAKKSMTRPRRGSHFCVSYYNEYRLNRRPDDLCPIG